MATFKTTNVEELKEMLKNEIVNFSFTKKDGTIRQAKGTLIAELLPAPKTDSKPHKKNENIVVFFDLEKNEFRSLRKETFIGAY